MLLDDMTIDSSLMKFCGFNRELKSNSTIHWKSSEHEITRITTDSNPTNYVFGKFSSTMNNRIAIHC